MTDIDVAKDLVVIATTELFSGDATAVDGSFAATYRQHSTTAPDGTEGARFLTANLPPGFRYDRSSHGRAGR